MADINRFRGALQRGSLLLEAPITLLNLVPCMIEGSVLTRDVIHIFEKLYGRWRFPMLLKCSCGGPLPTKANLFKNKIVLDPLCPICGLEEETTKYKFIELSSSKR